MDIIAPLLFSLPVWVVLLVGIVFGMLTYTEHRRVSVAAVVALGGFLALDVVGTLVWTSYEWLNTSRGGLGLPGYVTNAFFVLQTLLHAGLIGLAIVAALQDRRMIDASE